MTTPPLPKRINAEHVCGALRRCGALGDGRVAEIVVESVTATILSHIFRLRLTYEGAARGAPDSLILKAGLVDRPGGPWKGGHREVGFYNDVAAAMPAGLTPRSYDAQWDEATGAWHIIMEDLTDSHFIATRWPLPPTLAQCESIVRARARFQAAWWDDRRLGATIGSWEDAETANQSWNRLAIQFASFADDLGDRLSPARRTLYDRLFAAAPRLQARYHTHRGMTLIQGDAHVWNCFLQRSGGVEDARLFDWDAWRPGIGSSDLAYMMAIHWQPDLRQRFESSLLDCFHDELTDRGVRGYDRRALQEDYRLSTLLQITTPVWQRAIGIPPVIWWNNFERVHLAVDDLGCCDLLGD